MPLSDGAPDRLMFLAGLCHTAGSANARVLSTVTGIMIFVTDKAKYSWIFDDGLDIATCVTVVPGGEADDVLRRFGADTTTTLAVDEADRIDGIAGPIAATAVPGGVVTVEPNGFQGALEDVLLRVAGDGVAASVFWNVNDHNSFIAVRGGAVVVSIDMYDLLDADDPELLLELGLPDELHDLCRAAAEAQEQPWATGLAMAEVFTGVPIPRQAVSEPATFHAFRRQ